MKKKLEILKEFKEFAVRGNVIDMAVGIIIGAAFGKIIDSLVKDVVMPPVGVLTGGIDFSNHFVSLSGGSYKTLAEAQTAGAVTLNYGIFINAILSFLIIATCVFFLVKMINKLKQEEDVKSVAPSQKSCPHCFKSISIKATRCPYCTSKLDAAGN